MTNSLFRKQKCDQIFLKFEKLAKLVVDTGREYQILGPWQSMVNWLRFMPR